MPPALAAALARKTLDAKVLDTTTGQTADGAPAGIVRVLFSKYDHPDYDEDITRPGTFRPLLEKIASGRLVPYVFAHGSWDIENYLGVVTAVEESPDGPIATAQLLLDDQAGAKAFALMAAGALREHSYQYEVLASHVETLPDGKTVRVLDQVDVFEIGPCLRGANDQTDVLDAKGLKAGRVLSAANEQKLRDAAAAITAVLDQVTVEDQPKTAAEDPAQGKTTPVVEDPAPGKATPREAPEDPARGNGADQPLSGTTAEDIHLLAEGLRLGATP